MKYQSKLSWFWISIFKYELQKVLSLVWLMNAALGYIALFQHTAPPKGYEIIHGKTKGYKTSNKAFSCFILLRVLPDIFFWHTYGALWSLKVLKHFDTWFSDHLDNCVMTSCIAELTPGTAPWSWSLTLNIEVGVMKGAGVKNNSTKYDLFLHLY